MPEGMGFVIALLCIGYFLLLVELVVPGGLVGIGGFILIGYGVYEAFGLSMAWGFGSIVVSLAIFTVLVWIFLKNRRRKGLVLGVGDAKEWKSASPGLADLIGTVGVTATMLRPAGTMLLGEERIDVISDGEFLAKGVRVRVVDVEGARVVVEATEDEEADDPASAAVAPNTTPDGPEPESSTAV